MPHLLRFHEIYFWNPLFLALGILLDFVQSVFQSEIDDQLTTISCAISSANFKLQVVLNKIFQKIFFSKSTSILPINYI